MKGWALSSFDPRSTRVTSRTRRLETRQGLRDSGRVVSPVLVKTRPDIPDLVSQSLCTPGLMDPLGQNGKEDVYNDTLEANFRTRFTCR